MLIYARHKPYDLPTVSQSVTDSATNTTCDGDSIQFHVHSIHSIDFHCDFIEFRVSILPGKFSISKLFRILSYKIEANQKPHRQINPAFVLEFSFVLWITFEVAGKCINKIPWHTHRYRLKYNLITSDGGNSIIHSRFTKVVPVVVRRFSWLTTVDSVERRAELNEFNRIFLNWNWPVAN